MFNFKNVKEISHTEQECQKTLIQGKIYIPQNRNEDIEYL